MVGPGSSRTPWGRCHGPAGGWGCWGWRLSQREMKGGAGEDGAGLSLNVIKRRMCRICRTPRRKSKWATGCSWVNSLWGTPDGCPLEARALLLPRGKFHCQACLSSLALRARFVGAPCGAQSTVWGEGVPMQGGGGPALPFTPLPPTSLAPDVQALTPLSTMRGVLSLLSPGKGC